jgi:hypothetical protein
MGEIEIIGWSDLQEKLFEDSWNEQYSKWISPYVFRGLNDKNDDPKTTLNRLCNNNQCLKVIERALIRNFRKYAPPEVVGKDTNDWQLLSIAQHHGLPTRLLDWTYSPFVAMHFATSDFDKSNIDGAVWAVNYKEAHKDLPTVLRRKLKKSEASFFTIEMLAESFKSLNKFEESNPTPFLVLLEPPAIDDRIVNQFAVFSVISNATVVPHNWLIERPAIYRKIVIPAKLKHEIRCKLDQSNITERVLFPGLDGLCTWLKRHYRPM